MFLPFWKLIGFIFAWNLFELGLKELGLIKSK